MRDEFNVKFCQSALLTESKNIAFSLSLLLDEESTGLKELEPTIFVNYQNSQDRALKIFKDSLLFSGLQRCLDLLNTSC